MSRFINLLLLTVLFVVPATAQVLPLTAVQTITGNFYGKIIDDSLQKPVEGAFVQLLHHAPDSTSKKRKDFTISTQVTNKKGEFNMELQDRTIVLKENEFLIIPRGVEHRPVAENEVSVMLFEPVSTLNTGDTRGEMTRDTLARI